MGRGFVTFTLACIVATAAVSASFAADGPVRLAIEEGGANVSIDGASVIIWKDGTRDWALIEGGFAVRSGQLSMRAERAVVWSELGADTVHRGEIYAEGRLSGVQQLKPGDAALLSFAASHVGFTVKTKPRDEAPNSWFVRRATAAMKPRMPNPFSPRVAEQPYNPNIQLVQNQAPPLDPILGNAEPPPSAPGAPPPPKQAASPRAGTEPPIFESPSIPLPNVNTRKLKIGNRSSNPTNAKYLNMPNGDQIALITGGVKLLATFEQRGGMVLDVEADQLVIWQNGGQAHELVEAMTDREGITQGNERHTELYMSGNVVIRYGRIDGKNGAIGDMTMRADRIYYDVSNNRAIAKQADLEFTRPGLKVPAHFSGEQIEQISPVEFWARNSNANASAMPASPGIDLRTRETHITEQKNQVERTIFGVPIIDRRTGEQIVGSDRRFRTRNTFVDVEGVPVMWFPYLAGDVDDPVGPLNSIYFRNDKIFGTQFLTTWDVLELIGIKKLPGERFNLMADYLSERGFALGLSYDLAGPNLFGFDAPFVTRALAYGLHDEGVDVLGGTRSQNWDPPGYRGRALFRHVQEYDNFLFFQGQISYLSDVNFLEQYYNNEFNMGPNNETVGYLKAQRGNWAASVLGEPNIRPWITETEWLPRVDGYWLGQSFFDRFTYNTWANAGYANLNVYNLPFNQYPQTIDPFTVPTPDYPINTARLDWMHQLSMPFGVGPFRIVPYVVGDVAYYSNDVNGDSRGRLYGGAGTRASMPLSRQFDDVESELFNVHGINHKVLFAANYYTSYSNTPLSLLPQLDRLNDDATMESVRDITPWQTTFVPGPDGQMLFNSPLYNPRLYALRRLLDTKPDELDTIQVLQGDLRQRWQTKRGYPGMEHTVDYFALDLSASYFPAANRDNFGHPFSFLEYNAAWAVGDRNGFTSSGWVDPFAFGTRYFSVNGYFNRPDGTNFNLGYRHFDPVGSRQLFGSLAYTFSPKYQVSFYYSYDLEISNNQSTGLTLLRVGTDLTWSLGFSYNAILNNFSFNLMVTPNLAGSTNGSMFNQNSAKGRN